MLYGQLDNLMNESLFWNTSIKGPWYLLERIQSWQWSQLEKTTKHSSQTPAKHWRHSHTHTRMTYGTHITPSLTKNTFANQTAIFFFFKLL